MCVGNKIHKLVFQTYNTSCFIFREFKEVLIEVNDIIQIRLGYTFYFFFFSIWTTVLELFSSWLILSWEYKIPYNHHDHHYHYHHYHHHHLFLLLYF